MDLDPTVSDSSGYVVNTDDLDFLTIAVADFQSLGDRTAPLGMTPADYQEVVRSLFDALDADGIDDADVRIQGSSVRFFSSALKPMLYRPGDLVAEFRDQFGRLPSTYEADRMKWRLAGHWPKPGPKDRPFDSLFVIGAAAEKSDIDFQVSSAAVRDRLEAAANALGVPLADIQVIRAPYNFFQKDIVDSEFPHISIWRIRAIEMLQRPVTVAMFDAGGPPIVGGPVSSHFQDGDWTVRASV